MPVGCRTYPMSCALVGLEYKDSALFDCYAGYVLKVYSLCPDSIGYLYLLFLFLFHIPSIQVARRRPLLGAAARALLLPCFRSHPGLR